MDDYDLQDELKAIVNYGSEIAFLPTKKQAKQIASKMNTNSSLKS